MRSPSVLVAVLLALGPTLAGCSDDDPGGARSTVTERDAAAARADGDVCRFRGSTIGREATTGTAASTITSAEVSQDFCVDRIAFSFTSSDEDLPPRYEASYEPGPFRDFNQEFEITVGGNAFLVIRFDQTTAIGPEGDLLYESRESIEPADLHHLQELRLVVAPEGSAMFVIGLDSERPFVVDGAASPPRVIVEIG